MAKKTKRKGSARGDHSKLRALAQTKYNSRTNQTIAVLAKVIAGYLPKNRGIFVKSNDRKFLVHWENDSIKIESAEEFEGFEDGLIIQAKEPENVVELDTSKEEVVSDSKGIGE